MEATMGRLTKHTDLLAAGAVVLVVIMMIIPLPPMLVDLCISLNISLALAIVVTTLYLPTALDFSSFPSLLLLTTLFRLAINVSVTRLVLLKGDATAGLMIVAINLIGGIIIGLLQKHMSIGEAGHHFSLLTVGDGLSAQIPALMISVATGIIVTRSASQKDLGNDIADQITGQKKAPMVAGVVMLVLAMVPGLPKIPFIVIGGLFLMLWRFIKDRPT